MGYLHIPNSYQFIRDYPEDYKKEKEVWALSKIHGSSSNIAFNLNQPIRFFAGGAKQEQFESLFDKEYLLEVYNNSHWPYTDGKLVLFGEAYGSPLHKMGHTYGNGLKFVGFDVKYNDKWLNVPAAEIMFNLFRLDFVHYWEGPNTLEFLNECRDHPSIQAKKNGILEDRPEEGIVIRPLEEKTVGQYGKRWICKHKREEFSEVKTPRIINDEDLKKYTLAKDIASEFVTDMRLEHILSKQDKNWSIADTGFVVKSMIDDVKREGAGEIEGWNQKVEKEIGRRAALLFKARVT